MDDIQHIRCHEMINYDNNFQEFHPRFISCNTFYFNFQCMNIIWNNKLWHFCARKLRSRLLHFPITSLSFFDAFRTKNPKSNEIKIIWAVDILTRRTYHNRTLQAWIFPRLSRMESSLPWKKVCFPWPEAQSKKPSWRKLLVSIAKI